MKTTKSFALLPIILILGFACTFKTTTRNDQNRTNCIYIIANAFHNKDSVTLNKFIHPDYHLHILFKRGTMPEYSQTDRINFDQPVPEYPPYSNFKADYKIKYQTLPVYNCDSSAWNQVGLFCDTLSRDHLLSKTASDLKMWRGDKIEDNKINWFKELENKSDRIVLADDEKGELIFYLTFINGKWYLTILDRVSSDCSA